MLYIVSGELVPEANTLYHGRMTAIRKYNRFFNWYFCDRNIGTNVPPKQSEKTFENFAVSIDF